MTRLLLFTYWFLIGLTVIMGVRALFIDPADEAHMRAHLDDRLVPLYKHMFISSLGLALMPLQMSAELRNTRPRLHPRIGMLCAPAMVLGGLASLPLTPHLRSPDWGIVGFQLGALLWVATATAGLWCAIRRNWRAHGRWMTYAAVLAFGSVTIRLEFSLLQVTGLSYVTAYGVAGWTCWTGNLAAYWIWRWRADRRHRHAIMRLEAG